MTGLQDLPLRDELRELTPYGAPQLDVAVRLNTNENPYPPPPQLVSDITAAVAAAAATLNRYPDREAVELRAALGAYLGGLAVERIWAANGSNEILQQLLMAFGGPGRVALAFVPSYSMHHLIARTTGTAWRAMAKPVDYVVGPEQVRAAVEEHQPDIVFLCSPDNPTGRAVTPEAIHAALSAAPGMVVVDEAYAEFSAHPSSISLLEGAPRLVVTRTMSKAFAFAGARVGYLAADPAVVDALRLVRLPYHLSALTQEAARAALRHAPATLAQVAQLCADRDRLAAALRDLGLAVIDSDANFLLFGAPAGERELWQALLEQGVLVRDVGLSGWLRVSVGTTEECTAFLDALRKVLA